MNLKILELEEANQLILLIKDVGEINITTQHLDNRGLISLILQCQRFPKDATEYELISFIGLTDFILVPGIMNIPRNDLHKIQDLSNFISKLNHKYIYAPKQNTTTTAVGTVDDLHKVETKKSDSEKDIQERIRKIIYDQLGVNMEQIVPEASIVDDLGADDLDEVEIVMTIEEEFGIEIDEDEAQKCKKLSDYVNLMCRLLGVKR